ncbi:MAG: 3-phosphoshikimate 1-carboxyvinyltransferase [Capnocytophaga sp.]|nr:3-phosphoshikimate 1-carboxyvinyltransferase [Capnocytophaga sp.]
MDIFLPKSQLKSSKKLHIESSKSETNRLLLLQALFPEIKLENYSTSDDSVLMQKALQSQQEVIDIQHAGTAMRFLTAFFAIQEGRKTILTGSSRMKERPIKILVDALRELGAEINYLEKEGFPPLEIIGKKLEKKEVSLLANTSSQYISALALIGSYLTNGLKINLIGKYTSLPYIYMTLALLNQIGVKTSFVDNQITIKKEKAVTPQTITIEPDWSAASYFYSLIAQSKVGTSLFLSYFKENSLQGDRKTAEIYHFFGVETIFHPEGIEIIKKNEVKSTFFSLEMSDTPDIAQTIAVTCVGLGLECHLTGLHTLKIKETDRLLALQNELQKLGQIVKTTENEIFIKPQKLIENIEIETYNDHRMAMSFATLCTKIPIIIKDKEVVSKSYPNFWEDLAQILE